MLHKIFVMSELWNFLIFFYHINLFHNMNNRNFSNSKYHYFLYLLITVTSQATSLKIIHTFKQKIENYSRERKKNTKRINRFVCKWFSTVFRWLCVARSTTSSHFIVLFFFVVSLSRFVLWFHTKLPRNEKLSAIYIEFLSIISISHLINGASSLSIWFSHYKCKNNKVESICDAETCSFNIHIVIHCEQKATKWWL